MSFRQRKLSFFALLTLLAFSFEVYYAVPDEISVIDGTGYSTPYGVTEHNGELRLFGVLPYKTVQVNVIEDDEVFLSGETVGISLDLDGLLVLGTAQVKNQNGKFCSPAKDAGLKEGDIIKQVNGQKVNSIEAFESILTNTEQAVMAVEREGNLITLTATPVQTGETKKLGVWLRGGSSGIGTLTFVTKDGNYGALGHPITDGDTGVTVKVGDGHLKDAKVLGIVKSQPGLPGEIQGTLKGNDLGDVYKNTDFGIFGTTKNTLCKNSMQISTKEEIVIGEAKILSDVAGGEPVLYSAQVLQVFLNSNNNKNMMIKVTDQRLINLTGGIVQGMSGSPIIQNGKFIGAVTHVFVNDPTRGYGVFAEKMLTETK